MFPKKYIFGCEGKLADPDSDLRPPHFQSSFFCQTWSLIWRSTSKTRVVKSLYFLSISAPMKHLLQEKVQCERDYMWACVYSGWDSHWSSEINNKAFFRRNSLFLRGSNHLLPNSWTILDQCSEYRMALILQKFECFDSVTFSRERKVITFNSQLE